ncbi:MAG: hypothetical protein EXQ58_05750 [Acidobacteria bacterium]|nr:hypothetical protein [Acidobacteriota bacterium]
MPKIYDGNEGSMVTGYLAFLRYVEQLRGELESRAVQRPLCNLGLALGMGWRAADIEMALFKWAEAGEGP